MAETRVRPDLLDAMEGILSLLNPGPYGVADTDPKARLIADLQGVVSQLSTPPVVIGGIAVIINGYPRQTADVDLLVARKDAMKLVRALEASGKFRRRKLERLTHVETGTGVDICVEGELTNPSRSERFPSPSAVETIPKPILPVLALVDLLVLKAKSGRQKDEADFGCLARAHGLRDEIRTQVLGKLGDPRVKEDVVRWWERARVDDTRERDVRPSWGDEE